MKYTRLKCADEVDKYCKEVKDMGMDLCDPNLYYPKFNNDSGNDEGDVEAANFNQPQDNGADIDPSAQPYAMNPGNQVQFMAGDVDLNQMSFLQEDPELAKRMNPIGDLENLSMYEQAVCVDGNVADRFEEDEPLFTEDPNAIYVDDTIQVKRNPTDPMLMFNADSDGDEYSEKQKNNTNVNLFPGTTYPMDGFESGVPYANSAPVNTYPGLM